MNCANHVDIPANRRFAAPGVNRLCAHCARDVRGVVFFEYARSSGERCHAASSPTRRWFPGATQVASGSPGLAALLGFIPGVGAMYNGEYAKGFIHVLIFATLIWAADNISGLFGIAIAAFVIYMPIEAYQTAKARVLGVQPPDPFGFNNLFSNRPPAAAVVAPAARFRQLRWKARRSHP